MFDIGFWELSIIGIVALLVIGPERLPAVARTVGKWVGRANRFIANVKDDINKELKDEELKRILVEQQKLAEQYQNTANEVKSSIESGVESVREDINQHQDDLLVIDEPETKSEIKSEPKQDPEPQKLTEKSQEQTSTKEPTS